MVTVTRFSVDQKALAAGRRQAKTLSPICHQTAPYKSTFRQTGMSMTTEGCQKKCVAG